MVALQRLHIVPKGWGFEKWITNSELYCGKILYIIKDRKCSWHYHKNKHETFYVQSGSILLRYGIDFDIKNSTQMILNKGDHFVVPPMLVHQMEGIEDTELFEFSTLHEDSDSYRVLKGD